MEFIREKKDRVFVLLDEKRVKLFLGGASKDHTPDLN